MALKGFIIILQLIYLMSQESINSNPILEEFRPLFYPKSVAIIGVNKNPAGGLKYYRALSGDGYLPSEKYPENEYNRNNKIYLINPKYADEGLFGLEVYSSLDDKRIKKPVDLVIIAVSAKHVPEALEQCNGKAKFAVIYTSGFREAGEEELDIKLRDTIARIDTRVIGPNCLGVINPYSGLSVFPGWLMFKGGVSYISQSGGTMARLFLYNSTIGIGFNNVVSIGNAYDITINELLKYFQDDDMTEVVALYLESIDNGREFFKITRQLSKQKPIVLFKGGQTDTGNQATFSHTGGLAGSYKSWQALAKQNGIMLVDHFELFADMVQVATIQPIPPKNLNVCILAAGGGIGVEFTDNFVKAGLKVPELSQKTQEELAKSFPPVNTNFKNPCDLGEYGYVPTLFAKAMKIVLADPNIGSVVFVREPERFPILSANLGIEDPSKLTIDSLKRVLKRADKPVFCNPSPNKDTKESYALRKEFKDAMVAAGIPVIDYFINIPEIIKQLYNYGKFLNS